MSSSYDPVRVGAPDHLVAEVDGLTGRRYRATGGGMYEMHPRDAQALVRAGGFTPGVGLALGGGGYRCPDCGFMAVVRTCSRCGQRCETRAERGARALGGMDMVIEANLAAGAIREIGPLGDGA